MTDHTPEPIIEEPTTPADADTSDTEQGGNREAAKWRRQLRDTEDERDFLRDRLATYERAEVERLVGDQLADPADIWVVGTELDTLRGEGGIIDPDKVRDTVTQLTEQRPHWKRQRPSLAAPADLVTGDGRAPTYQEEAPTSWSEVFAQAREE